MPKLVHQTPSYRLHKRSGQARVRLGGREYWLGPHGSPESRREFDRLIAEWLANGRSLAPPKPGSAGIGLSVNELILAYWRHCESYYKRDGTPTTTLRNIRNSLKPVKELYGDVAGTDFGPLALKTVRKAMVDSGLCRSEVNRRVSKVRQWVKWCVAEELLPGDALYRLQAVAGLRPGTEGLRETKPVRPVTEADIEAVLPHVSAPIAAMIGLQKLTGMRPNEVLGMTTGQIDRSGDVWLYMPNSHKTAHLGRTREIPIGPKAQAILLPWLKADPESPLFSPRAAVADRNETKKRNRKTPMTPSQRRRRPKANPKRAPGEGYHRSSYIHAIHRACQVAGIPVWGPNRLRHLAATAIRREFGLEAAQVILGHAKADVTQVYAEADLAQALEVARKVG